MIEANDKSPRLWQRLEDTFLRIYPILGKDGEDMSVPAREEAESLYHRHWVTKLMLLISGPVNNSKKPRKQGLLNLLKDFIQWDSDDSNTKKILQTPFIPVLLLINILKIIANLSNNILKIVTELTPALLSTACEFAAEKLEALEDSLMRENDIDASWLTEAMIFSVTASLSVMKILQYVSYCIFLVGRAVTSPIQSLQAAWQTRISVEKALSQALGDTLLAKGISLLTSRAVGALLVLTSIAIGLAFLKFVLAPAMSFALGAIASISPPVIIHAAQVAANFLNMITNTIVNGISQAIVATVGNVLHAAGLAMTTVSQIGLAYANVTLGLLMTVVFPALPVIKAKILNRLSTIAEKIRNVFTSAPTKDVQKTHDTVNQVLQQGITGSINTQAGNVVTLPPQKEFISPLTTNEEDIVAAVATLKKYGIFAKPASTIETVAKPTNDPEFTAEPIQTPQAQT